MVVDDHLLFKIIKQFITNLICFINRLLNRSMPSFELVNLLHHQMELLIFHKELSAAWIILSLLRFRNRDLIGLKKCTYIVNFIFDLVDHTLKFVDSESFFKHFHFFEIIGISWGLYIPTQKISKNNKEIMGFTYSSKDFCLIFVVADFEQIIIVIVNSCV